MFLGDYLVARQRSARPVAYSLKLADNGLDFHDQSKSFAARADKLDSIFADERLAMDCEREGCAAVGVQVVHEGLDMADRTSVL